jgi:esterase/lipase
MRNRTILRLVPGAVLALTATLASAEPGKIGLVLLHGKQGLPQQFERLSAALTDQAMLVETPEMCWSRDRIYDRDYVACLDEVDAAVARVKQRGAVRIVVGGQSLGGNGALGYGARRSGLAGIVAMAPAHAPQFLSQRPEIAASLDKARAMVARGQGDARAAFADVNTGEGTSSYNFEVTTTAKIYLSFFAPNSPAIMPTNATRLSTPLLIISSPADPSQRGARYLYAAAHQNKLNRFVAVDATHRGTPAASRAPMLEWLADLK